MDLGIPIAIVACVLLVIGRLTERPHLWRLGWLAYGILALCLVLGSM